MHDSKILLQNILYTLLASLNFLLVNKLYVDNDINIEFYPASFCVKDLETKKVLF